MGRPKPANGLHGIMPRGGRYGEQECPGPPERLDQVRKVHLPVQAFPQGENIADDTAPDEASFCFSGAKRKIRAAER